MKKKCYKKMNNPKEVCKYPRCGNLLKYYSVGNSEAVDV